MSLVLLLLILFLLFGGIGTYPRWSYNQGWGYGPFSLVTVLLIIVIILAMTGGLRI